MIEPTMTASMSERPLLILDLDETIVWATEEPRDAFDFRTVHYFVVKRPHLDTFLRRVREGYDLAVWSSSGDSYATQVVREVFGEPSRLRFAWARSRCTRKFDSETGEYRFEKNLGKLKRQGFDLARVLMLDDSPEKLRRHYGNYLRLRAFTGEPDDRELLDVLPFLEWLATRENFRTIEKRDWTRAILTVPQARSESTGTDR